MGGKGDMVEVRKIEKELRVRKGREDGAREGEGRREE